MMSTNYLFYLDSLSRTIECETIKNHMHHTGPHEIQIPTFYPRLPVCGYFSGDECAGPYCLLQRLQRKNLAYQALLEAWSSVVVALHWSWHILGCFHRDVSGFVGMEMHL